MSKRRCWTCSGEHDLDEACSQGGTARSARAAGGTLSSVLVDDAPAAPEFGPVFTATYESDCESCDEAIVPGEDIRADGRGSWIHADDQCERIARQ